MKLHVLKCNLFQTQVRWCGRIIDAKGVRMDPKNLETLVHMQPPSMGDHLQQLICAANWMRTAIPDFTNHTRPLAEALEKVY